VVALVPALLPASGPDAATPEDGDGEEADGEDQRPRGRGPSAEALRVAEARAVAGFLKAEVAGGRTTVRAPDGVRRPLGYGDAAILLRAMTDVAIYEDVLRAADVPYRISGGKDYYRRGEVQALVRLLEATCDPGDQVAV